MPESLTGGAEGQVAGSIVGNPFGGLQGRFSPSHVLRSLRGGNTDPGISPVTRMGQQEWEWYMQNIAPLQQKALQTALSPYTAQRNIEQASTDVGGQFDALPDVFKRQMSRLGATVTPQQQEQFDRQATLNKGIASVSAMNQARTTTEAQSRGILGIGG